MKTKITAVCLSIVISGCAVEATSITNANGKQAYTMNCNSGIEKCHEKSAELCLNGHDIIEHSKESSTVYPHYGEYPLTLSSEILTIECK